MDQVKPLRPTAILVEDDFIQRSMIALILSEINFDVIQCEDAETASLAVKARHPSLLITDVNLTGRMNGIELAHYARRHDPKLRIVVLSGEPTASALPDNVTFFSKPVSPTEFIRGALP